MIAGVIEKRIVKDDINLPSAELKRFENREVTKIFVNKDNVFLINDEVTDINKISDYIKTNKVNEVVVIADNTLYVSDVSLLLTALYQNNIKNIKLLSNRNAN
tara:strand:- start:497 stop:805 length:309 start_codon:yes stop_codon:yes gene_type:complete